MSAKDLQIINGIGPTYAQRLFDSGITSIEQLAGSSADALVNIVEAPAWRADYAGWIAQAKRLADSSESLSSEGKEDISSLHRQELEAILADLNELTTDLQQLFSEKAPRPDLSQGVLSALSERTGRYTPETIRTLQEALQEIMEGLTAEDMKDPETWKGIAYTLNYLAKAEASERSEGLLQRLAGLPGAETVIGLKEMLADTPPEEFLRFDTWKGIAFLISYELQNQAERARNRVVGSQTSDEEDAEA
ncbi:MAG: hypothetical protein GY759_20160 [Chloroflexi bacterium]|nr:hypothetical protein [Chloroflexota bacterium]